MKQTNDTKANNKNPKLSPKRPFIITGASATGKTSLAEMAVEYGYAYLPSHTTRLLRPHEIQGTQIVSLTEEQFLDNFDKHKYLEPSLDFARLHSTGIYYGTPIGWIDLLQSENVCAIPVSITIARKIFDRLAIKWVHLVCDDSIREDRLKKRGISSSEINARIMTGDCISQIPSEAVIYDTFKMTTYDILYDIISNGEQK
jgi:guanylate kinase